MATRRRPQLSGALNISLQPKQKQAWDYVTGGTYTWVGLGGSKGGGKLNPVNTYVSTPKGPRTLGSLNLGDQITDPTTGGTTTVVQIFEHPVMPIWKFTFDDGATLCSGADHLWAFYITGHIKPRRKRSSERDFARENIGYGGDIDEADVKLGWTQLRVGPTSAIISMIDAGKKIRVPLTEPVIYTKDRDPGGARQLTPYLLGLFLGDGHMASTTITTMDPETVELLSGLGYSSSNKARSKAVQMRARGTHGSEIRRHFKDMGIFDCRAWEKFIPEPFLLSRLEDRLDLLRGLMDTDGTVDERGRCYYTTTSPRLAEDVVTLVRSLGGKASVGSRRKTYDHDGQKKVGRVAYQIRVWLKKTSAAFSLPRKKARCKDNWNGGIGELTRQLVKIERVEDQRARCITVSSPFGLYVAGDTPRDFIVTHNSGAARRILIPLLLQFPGSAALLVRKTYREVVMNHVERIMLEFPMLAPFYNKSDQMFRIPHDSGAVSRLHIGYGENEGDVRRYNGTDDFAWVYVDQAEEFPEADINTLRTCLRSTIPGVKPTLVLSFNPGGPSHQFLKRIFVDRDFKKDVEDPSHYGPLIEARGWDNVEWCRTELERDGFTVDDYYYKWDEEKRRTYFLASHYGQNLLANPDKTMRDWYLWGRWDTFSGQYFDQFDPEKHTYRPEMAQHLEPEFYRWISCDIAFAHEAAIYWHCFDGERIYTYREHVEARVEPVDLAHIIVEKSRGEQIGAFYLSHEAFGTRQSVKTQASMMAEILLQNGLPAPAPPDLDKVGGLRLMNYLLVTGGWRISRDCPQLIKVLPNAIRDPKNPESTLKFDGDDPIDAARYGIKTYQRGPAVSRDKILAAAVKSDDETIKYLQLAVAEAKLKAAAPKTIPLAPRSRWLRRFRRAS